MPRILSIGAAGVALALSLAACGDGKGTTDPPPPPPTPASITATAGSPQTGTVGQALSLPLVARVADASGKPISGTAVAFAVATGGGSVTPASATTDAQGQAQATWTLGTTAGAQSVTASATGVATPATFTATAAAGEPAKLSVSTAPATTAGIGVALATAPVVQLQDQHGNAVARAGTQVTVAATGATLSGTATATTNASGTATFPGLSLSGAPGAVTLTFSATGLTSAAANTTLAWTRSFSVAPVAGFVVTGHIPNAAWLPAENKMVLIFAGQTGQVEASSTDGVNFTGMSTTTQKFQNAMAPAGLGAADMLVRQTAAGGRRYLMKGTRPGDARPIAVYAADGTTTLTLVSPSPVYSGPTADSSDIGVMDIVPTRTGGWRMFYVARRASPGNSRTATSTDEGRTWTFESDNPFGDKALAPTASNMNVDPAPLRLADGSYMAVTMRATKLYFWNSWDGLTFTQVSGLEVSASQWSSIAAGGNALYDPTLVQLPNGRIYMYVALGASGQPDRLVAAEITAQ